MVAWRVARSLVRLIDQSNALWPNRSKSSDGTIGDAEHASRDSDHNPWYGPGIVTAADITHDPRHGADMHQLAASLVASRDRRIKYCLTPGHRVLAADLVWRPVESLGPGDEVIAFDEWGGRPGTLKGHAGAKIRTGTVEATRRFVLPCYEVVTDRGTVVASEDHLWLRSRAYQGTYRRWTRTPDFRPGDQIQYFAAPWDQETSFDAGWLAGLFDGEGSLSRAADGSSGWSLQVSQREGRVLDRAQHTLDTMKFRTVQHRNGSVTGLHLRGGLPEILRLLGSVPTERLTTRAVRDRIWEGHMIAGSWPTATVYEVRPIGPQEVVAVSTSTRTLIAEGMLSHNCIWNRRIASGSPGPAPWVWRTYTGASPHTGHLHISVVASPLCDNTAAWQFPVEDDMFEPTDRNRLIHVDDVLSKNNIAGRVNELSSAVVQIQSVLAALNTKVDQLLARQGLEPGEVEPPAPRDSPEDPVDDEVFFSDAERADPSGD